MYLKTCKCGKSKKNFKIDIGPDFMGKCCIEAGYDRLGNKAEVKAPAPKEELLEEPVAMELVEEASSEPEASTSEAPSKKRRKKRKK